AVGKRYPPSGHVQQRLGAADRHRSPLDVERLARTDRRQLVAGDARHAAVGSAVHRHDADELDERAIRRRAARGPRRESRAAVGRADARALVQHRRLRAAGAAAVRHERPRYPPRRRHRQGRSADRQAGRAQRAADAAVPRRAVQRVQSHRCRSARPCVRRAGLRDRLERARRALDAARGAVRVLGRARRRHQVNVRALILATAAAWAATLVAAQQRPPERAASAERPNIVFVLADDLGYGELGSYGQKKIRTPRLDRMAAEGMRFTQFYSGSTVCAPSRGTLLTGVHTGHAYVRDNQELGGFLDEEERGQIALPPDHPTVARWLRARGYATAVIGKWGLGGPHSTGVPTKQGFDFFFGYLDQKQAHNYYPTHLWRNEERYPLRNAYFSPHQTLEGDPRDPKAYEKYRGTDYAIDFMTREATDWLRANRSTPFLLYFAPTIPHVALQVPEAALKEYDGRFPETPYTGDKRYLPQRTPRAAYAAM